MADIDSKQREDRSFWHNVKCQEQTIEQGDVELRDADHQNALLSTQIASKIDIGMQAERAHTVKMNDDKEKLKNIELSIKEAQYEQAMAVPQIRQLEQDILQKSQQVPFLFLMH